MFKDASDNINGTFVGNITGNVTGNVSGTAATVTGAAQPNITSLGTLTTLTVDDITINGSTISDSANLTFDVGGDIVLDADGGDLKFKNDGTEILRISSSSNNAVIRPVVDAKDLIFQQRDGTEVARVEDNGTFNVVTDKLAINGTAITSTAAEINKLDGVTATTTELNYVDVTTLGTVQASKAVTASSGGDVLFPSGSVLTTTSDGSNPSIVIQGSGPNELMFAGDASGSDTDGVSLLYRTTPNDLEIVRASGQGVIAKFNGNTGVAELYHANSKKLETTSGGIEVTGTVTDDGATHDGDVTFTGANGNIVFDKSDDALEFADDVKAKFGTGGDLEIYHDSSRDYISDQGTGPLRILGSQIEIKNAGDNSLGAKFVASGAVELNHNNVKKLETTTTGATVTGTLVADGVTLGDSEVITLGTDSDATITHTGSNLEIDNNTGILKLFSGQVYIQGQFGSSDETMAQFSKNGPVKLFTTMLKNLKLHLMVQQLLVI